MPYIHPNDRPQYNFALDQLPTITTKGDLEYCIFKLIKMYMSTREYKYTELHNAVYAAVHAAHEFERRFLDARENKAISINGDIK